MAAHQLELARLVEHTSRTLTVEVFFSFLSDLGCGDCRLSVMVAYGVSGWGLSGVVLWRPTISTPSTSPMRKGIFLPSKVRGVVFESKRRFNRFQVQAYRVGLMASSSDYTSCTKRLPCRLYDATLFQGLELPSKCLLLDMSSSVLTNFLHTSILTRSASC